MEKKVVRKKVVFQKKVVFHGVLQIMENYMKNHGVLQVAARTILKADFYKNRRAERAEKNFMIFP